MKFYGKAKAAAQKVLDAFNDPDALPEAIANITFKFGDKPSNQWSIRNRLIMALSLTGDARGFKQWQAVGRKVKKGGSAIYILGPLKGKRTDEDSGESTSYVYGFKGLPVFPYASTEGDPLPEQETIKQVISELPLINLAEKWGIDVHSHEASITGNSGQYAHSNTRKVITLGVTNFSTWAHELTHAADHRLGNLTIKEGQQIDNEYVAELGGCVLLKLLGHHVDADIGGCYRYLKMYADEHEVDLAHTAMNYLERTCKAIDLILTESGTVLLPD